MRLFVGIIGRLVFWAGLIFIVGQSALVSYLQTDYGTLIIKIIFFPATYLIWPWYSGLWPILIISLLGYWVSTFIGNIGSVE